MSRTRFKPGPAPGFSSQLNAALDELEALYSGVPPPYVIYHDGNIENAAPRPTGAPARRTLADRFSDTLNLLDYLLLFDVDHTNAFNRVIARAQSLNRRVCIDVPAGTYTISGIIHATLTGGQVILLRGAGSAVTRIVQTADADGIRVEINNYGPSYFDGGAFDVTGLTFEQAAPGSSGKAGLVISSAGIAGNTGKPLVLDDLCFVGRGTGPRWNLGLYIERFNNTAYLSRISVIGCNGGMSLNGTATEYQASCYLRDFTVFGGTALTIGQYWQGLHIDNMNAINTPVAIQCTPTAGVCEELIINDSYLMGRSIFAPSGAAALNTVRIANTYFDSLGSMQPGDQHVSFNNCPYVTLIGDTFNGSNAGIYIPDLTGLGFTENCNPTLVLGCTFQNYGGVPGQTGTGVSIAANASMCNFIGNAFNGVAKAVSDLSGLSTFAHTTINGLHFPFSLPVATGVTAANVKAQRAGLSVLWNLSGGGGEVDLLLGREAGNGGLNIYSVGADGKIEGAAPIAVLDRFGGLSISDLSVAGLPSVGSAWTVTNPAVISAGGTLGTATGSVRAKKLGRTVSFTAEALVSANGSGTGTVNITLPFAAAANEAFGGRDFFNAKGIAGVIVSGSTTLAISLYDGTYPAVSGSRLVISGTYEATA